MSDRGSRVLKDDPLEIFRAAADAEKIQEYLLAFEQKQVQQATKQQGIAQNPEPMMQQEQAVRLPSRMLADQKVAILLRIAREDPNDPFSLVYEGMLNIAFDEAFGPLMKGMEQVIEVLPLDWNGRVRVDSHDSEPNRFAVYVQRQNGEYQWLEICETSAAMDSLIDRLAVINAYAEIHEKQARSTSACPWVCGCPSLGSARATQLTCHPASGSPASDLPPTAPAGRAW